MGKMDYTGLESISEPTYNAESGGVVLGVKADSIHIIMAVSDMS